MNALRQRFLKVARFQYDLVVRDTGQARGFRQNLSVHTASENDSGAPCLFEDTPDELGIGDDPCMKLAELIRRDRIRPSCQRLHRGVPLMLTTCTGSNQGGVAPKNHSIPEC
ncbi:MAG TPA: hypothetical protein VKM54_09650 [Myxococcota bacterium]|nr:hypothetical protein [Myxococcota bacterium]